MLPIKSLSLSLLITICLISPLSMAQNNQGVENLKKAIQYQQQKDYENAISYYLKAIALGNTSAMSYLGRLYEKESGITQNYPLAILWYLRAAELNEKNAPFYIGAFYMAQPSTVNNHQQAMLWFKKAAKFNDTQAMTNVGFFI